MLFQPKFIAMALIAVVALALLRTKRMSGWPKAALLAVSVFLFGIAGNLPVAWFESFAMHPSPMCAASKPMLFGIRPPFLVTLGVIGALTLIGPKLFCAAICPVGAGQELLSMLADRLKLRKVALPFRLASGLRLGLFVAFLVVSVGGLLTVATERGPVAKSLYDYVNPFHGFEVAAPTSFVDALTHYGPFVVVAVAAVWMYRPFCYAACPIGLYTNLLEQVGLLRVSKERAACSDCGHCVTASRCPTVQSILDESSVRPDCYACNRCVESCPTRALHVAVPAAFEGETWKEKVARDKARKKVA